MPLRLLFFLFFSLFFHQLASFTDTITPNRPLKDGQVLTSEGHNNFALGFFSPGNSTRHRYVGIWCNKISLQTIVWVANRDNPINGSDGILSILNDGNLVLSSHNSTVWSTNITHPRNRTNKDVLKAQLQDSGNLILVIGDGSQNAAWQSFDYPTHVFLPGMKLGLDRRTGFSGFLYSWKSPNDPGHGKYSFRVPPDDRSPVVFFLYKDGSVPIWRTGPWLGQGFSKVPVDTKTYFLEFRVVDDPDEVYFTYRPTNASTFPIVVLNGESGTMESWNWHEGSHQWIRYNVAPHDECDDYAYCGPFGLCNPSWSRLECSCFPGYQPKSPREWYMRDASDGCTRVGNNVSMCHNGEGFVKLESVLLPDTLKAKRNMSMSLEECREECLKNCLCLAYTSSSTGGAGGGSSGPSGCMVYHGELIDTRVYDPRMGQKAQDLYVRVDAVELAKSLQKSKGHINKKLLMIMLTSVTTIFTALASIAYWFRRRNRRDIHIDWREEEEASLWLGEAEESDANSDLPVVFHLSTIVAATENFHPMNKLGEGGFGPVYKGKLYDGQEIAVKRLAKNSVQGIHEFKNEVRLIAKLQHKNLVKTLGCCVRGEEKMLIYEFLPNKSLDNYIFNEEKRGLLDWSKRYNIILGIARGILYLHQDSRLKIIHRDLKASNVLLDAMMNPKISDFGIARIFGNDQNEANTSRVVGTYGYMSPEYAMEGLFSTKSDIFSFGVIMLEIISGQKSSRYYSDQLSANLIGYVWKLWQDGNVMHIVDSSILLNTSSFHNEILRCIQIGLLCVQENPNERPTILEVIFMLSSRSELPSPCKPAFILQANHHNSGDPTSSSAERGSHCWACGA